jgi:hypothetical protein
MRCWSCAVTRSGIKGAGAQNISQKNIDPVVATASAKYAGRLGPVGCCTNNMHGSP